MLVTDRQDHSQRIQRVLNFVRPCRLASLHKPLADVRPVAIVSDVALDNAVSIELLRATLAHTTRNSAPLICILRDEARRTMTQAHALGAFDIVPLTAPRSVLIDVVLRAVTTTDDGTCDPRRAVAEGCARDVGFILADSMDAAADGGRVSPERVADGAQLVIRAIAEAGINSWLDVVWGYDDATYQHMLLVAGLSASFARAIGFSRRDSRRMTEAALVHDIGKAGVPIEILNKPGRLTADEMATMRAHAMIGYDILAAQGGFSPQLMAVVRSHHEYLDGTGYPDGLKGDEIPDVVRMVTICDIHAALIERRPYRAPLPQAEAFKIMDEMGGKLDRDIFGAFQKLMTAAA